MMLLMLLTVQATAERGRCDKCSMSARSPTVRNIIEPLLL